MSENTAASTAAAPKAPKAAKKPTTSKKPAPSANGKAPKPSRAMAEVPAYERRAELVKVLRAAKAFGASSALALADAVERTGYTRFDVYGLCNGTSGKAGSAPSCLVATGHVAVVKAEEGTALYLTAKGRAAKLDAAPFAKAEKAE